MKGKGCTEIGVVHSSEGWKVSFWRVILRRLDESVSLSRLRNGSIRVHLLTIGNDHLLYLHFTILSLD